MYKSQDHAVERVCVEPPCVYVCHARAFCNQVKCVYVKLNIQQLVISVVTAETVRVAACC